MDSQITGHGCENAMRPPMWLRLRVQHGFASTEETEQLAIMDQYPEMEVQHPYLAACAPSGCESSGSTGGCNPGTACLFTCLQSKQ